MDKALILNKIIEEFGFSNDVEFAKYIGVSPQVVYNWKKRNTFNQSILIEKLPEINKMFILTGEGPVRFTADFCLNQPQEQAAPNWEDIIREKDRIIIEQASHIDSLKQSLNMNEKIIDLMSETMKMAIMGEGDELNKKATKAG